LFVSVKTFAKLNLEHIDKFGINIKKISRRGSHFPDNAEFDHFTLLIFKGRQRNAPRTSRNKFHDW